MSYPADKGGNFATDAHRRVMANLPNPDDDPLSIEDLIVQRINEDEQILAYVNEAQEVVSILSDLEEEGYAKQTKAGWRNTPDGFDALTAPPLEPGAPGEAVVALDPATLTIDGSMGGGS